MITGNIVGLRAIELWMELYEFDQQKIDFFSQTGFKRDGILRENCFEDGRYWDSYIYSLLRDEWKSSQSVLSTSSFRLLEERNLG